MGPKNNAIELKDVCYSAGKSFEIRDLTLNVPYGSIYGFLGPNGPPGRRPHQLVAHRHSGSAPVTADP